MNQLINTNSHKCVCIGMYTFTKRTYNLSQILMESEYWIRGWSYHQYLTRYTYDLQRLISCMYLILTKRSKSKFYPNSTGLLHWLCTAILKYMSKCIGHKL